MQYDFLPVPRTSAEVIIGLLKNVDFFVYHHGLTSSPALEERAVAGSSTSSHSLLCFPISWVPSESSMQRTSLKVADAAELATTVAGATMVSHLQAYVVNRLGFGRHQTYNSLEVSQRSPEHLLQL